MADRREVIRGLAEVSEYTRAKADIAGVGKGKEIFDSWFRAVEDAIALLREQEPVEPTYEMIYDNKIPFCGICDTYLNFKMRFCPMCGRAVKWDAADRC